jgi:hypothetical protein
VRVTASMDGAMRLSELPIQVPPFFVEACGYRGAARYVGLQWTEDPAELLLSDDGHAIRGRARPIVLLWRTEGGEGALERFRTEREELGRTPWLLVDRSRRLLFIGDAEAVWRTVETQRLRHG